MTEGKELVAGSEEEGMARQLFFVVPAWGMGILCLIELYSQKILGLAGRGFWGHWFFVVLISVMLFLVLLILSQFAHKQVLWITRRRKMSDTGSYVFVLLLRFATLNLLLGILAMAGSIWWI